MNIITVLINSNQTCHYFDKMFFSVSEPYKQLFYRIPPVAASAFFKKVIKQQFCKGVNLKTFLKVCLCYEILIIFCSQHV